MSSGSDIQFKPCVITRDFDAPRQLVFDAWTHVEHLVNWNFPMKGVTCEYTKTDIRPRGSSLHKMIFPNGHEMWLLTIFEEINEPESLVFRQYMSNETGDILPNKMMPDWPKEMQASVFLEETDGKTRMTFTWKPVDPTRAEADCFEKNGEQGGKGWASAMEILAEYLATL
ncbi:MAG: SRPBCC domain-containing protein [Proteobacteria bacterium]|nr:SRPBCC domain-containing protein [Pseudomonadota bacterium]